MKTLLSLSNSNLSTSELYLSSTAFSTHLHSSTFRKLSEKQ